jgi:hypothetical protein
MGHRIRARLVLGLLVSCVAAPAYAGRSHFAWLYGSEVVPERGVELETWIVEENKQGDAKTDETSFWWGPVIALTDHLEFAISIEANYEAEGMERGVHFSEWGAEARYRVQSPDLTDAGPIGTLFRVGAKRLIEDRKGVAFEGDVVATYTSGRLHVAVDVGAATERNIDAEETLLRPGAGISVRAYQELRFGVETFGEAVLEGDGQSWQVVGPTISLTNGRFWGAATYGVGIFGIRDAPRVTFGVAL